MMYFSELFSFSRDGLFIELSFFGSILKFRAYKGTLSQLGLRTLL